MTSRTTASNDNAAPIERAHVVIHEADHGTGYVVGLHDCALIVPTRRCAEAALMAAGSMMSNGRKRDRNRSRQTRPP